jgi:hypothetical protein
MEFIKKKFVFLILLFSYLISAIFAFYNFNTCLDADGVSYINISNQIQNGNWPALINGYWSPLTPIVHAIFNLLIPNDVAAFQIMNIIAGIGIAYFFIQITQLLNIKNQLIIIGGIAFTSILGIWANRELNADILFLLGLVMLLYYIIKANHHYKVSSLLLVTIVLFFTKSYTLFYITLLFAGLVAYYFYTKNKKPAQILSISFVLFITCIITWGFVLKKTYHRFTISENGLYNTFIYNKGNINHPMDTIGILPASKAYHKSTWDNITLYLNDSILQKQPNILYKNNTSSFWQKIKQSISIYNAVPRLFCWISLFAICFIIYKKPKHYKLALYLLYNSFIFSMGYILYFIEFRYLLFPITIHAILLLYYFNLWISKNKIYTVLILCIPFYLIARWAFDQYYFMKPFYKENNDGYVAYQLSKHLHTKQLNENTTYATYHSFALVQLVTYNKFKYIGSLQAFKHNPTLLQQQIETHQPQLIIIPNNVTKNINIPQQYQLDTTLYNHNIYIKK